MTSYSSPYSIDRLLGYSAAKEKLPDCERPLASPDVSTTTGMREDPAHNNSKGNFNPACIFALIKITNRKLVFWINHESVNIQKGKRIQL